MPDTVKEMMSAYVAGCMDLRNLAQFVKFLDEGTYIPLDELGELQNIASLIPILLEREAPPASLQNEIFSQIPEDEPVEEPQQRRTKRKVNLSEIIKEELEEKQKPSEEEEDIEIPEKVSFTGLERETVVKEVAEKLEEEIFATKKSSKREEKKKKEVPLEEEQSPHPHVKIKASGKTEQAKKEIVLPPEKGAAVPEREFFQETLPDESDYKKLTVWKIATGVTALIAVIFAIVYFSSSSSYEEEIAKLRQKIKENEITIEDKTEFINQNLPLIEVFELKDLILVDLSSTTDAGSADARILISPSARRGIIQFVNLPEIAGNESLQLWIVNKGQSYSVGVFHPSEKEKFYHLTKIPFIPFDEIEMFRITKEPKGGAEFPTGKTLLFGAFRIK